MKCINPDTTMKPSGGFSQATVAGNMVFVAGQVAVNADMQLVGDGDMAAQTRQTLENVKAVLEASGASLQDVASTTVYVSSFDHYGEFDQVYQEYFGDHRPARATVKADLVMPQLMVEIQAIAVLERD